MSHDELAELARRLDAVEGIAVRRNVAAGEFCTYRVGGPVAVVATVDSSDALAEAAAVVAAADVPVLAIGRGSNLLVADAGFAGLGIVLGEGCARIDIDGARVEAGAAALLPVVARATVAAGLTGFEWAVGVPGSIGGAVRMNAGGHGSDMAASLVYAEIVDLRSGAQETRGCESLDLAYRRSNLQSWEIVASAGLDLEPGDPDAGARELSEIVAWRREHQPGGANAGSVFTNPSTASAGALIDSAGGKGVRVGSAAVSEKHANFIQVDPDGSADDVVALMELVVEMVERTHGVRLSAETHLVGFDAARVAGIQAPTAPGDDTGGAP